MVDVQLAPMTGRTDVLVTVPVHNEARILAQSIQRLSSGLGSSGLNHRLAIAEDGSTDGTANVLADLIRTHPGLLVQSLPNRRGRGYALRKLWGENPAQIYLFADADLAAGPSAIVDVVRAVENGADVATGSRYVEGARVQRPMLRHWVSKAYNGLVRALFHDGIRDHQCGLKAFRREAFERLAPLSTEDSWAWDTEVLVLARRIGLDVREVPVEWTEPRATRTPFRRLLADIRLHGRSIIRLRAQLGIPRLLARPQRVSSTGLDAPGVVTQRPQPLLH